MEGDEQCDGEDLGGYTCDDLSCTTGTPTCTTECKI